MYPAYVCESCERPHKISRQIWSCVKCHKDTCESCFGEYAHCSGCSRGKTSEELRLAANAAGYDFEPLPV